MIEYLMLILGLALLVKGADILVDGSATLAHKIGVSSLFIGLTVLAFGTSLPELIISLISATRGNSEIIYGNIIGSNMSNMLLVLGVTSLFMTIKANKSTVKKEIPYSIIAALLLLIFSAYYAYKNVQGTLHIIEGTILLIAFGLFLWYVLLMAKSDRKKTIPLDVEHKPLTKTKTILMILGGIIALYLGGRWTVNAAVMVAENLGMSEFFISATIIAIGTSLPELAISITAAIKKQIGMLFGNIIGSNIFNILWVIGITAVITPIVIPAKMIIDLTILILINCLLLFFVWKKKELNKKQGVILLMLYALYLIYLFLRG